jgi:hypothetical protein
MVISMNYKKLAFTLMVIIFSIAQVQAMEHGKKSSAAHGMKVESSKKSQHHSGHKGHKKKHMVKKVIAAVSKTGLNAEQVTQVTQAINQFKITKMQLKARKTPPLIAFKDDGFDEEAFKNHVNQYHAMKVDAKIKLFKQIYSILDEEQKKIFKREFTSHMIEKMIKKNMIKGKYTKSHSTMK